MLEHMVSLSEQDISFTAWTGLMLLQGTMELANKLRKTLNGSK